MAHPRTFPPTDDVPDLGAPAAGDHGFDTLLGLINQCVDAMNLMQERMAGLEEHARKTGDALARDKVDTRADLSTLRTRIKLAEASVDQIATRLTTCEASGGDAAAIQTREFAAARAEASTWRRQAETDLVRLNGMDARLNTVESDLQRRLVRTETMLKHVSAENSELRSRADQSEALAVDKAAKLAEASAALADQRARIGCLQSKLISATDTRRLAGGQKALQNGADTIMDLTPASETRSTTAA